MDLAAEFELQVQDASPLVSECVGCPILLYVSGDDYHCHDDEGVVEKLRPNALIAVLRTAPSNRAGGQNSQGQEGEVYAATGDLGTIRVYFDAVRGFALLNGRRSSSAWEDDENECSAPMHKAPVTVHRVHESKFGDGAFASDFFPSLIPLLQNLPQGGDAFANALALALSMLERGQ